jgi:hypothetical protein
MTEKFRDSNSSENPIAYAVGKDKINEILKQQNSVGLRVYMAVNELGETTILFVGVDELGNDIYEGKILNRVIHCPVICSEKNPLNNSSL